MQRKKIRNNNYKQFPIELTDVAYGSQIVNFRHLFTARVRIVVAAAAAAFYKCISFNSN